MPWLPAALPSLRRHHCLPLSWDPISLCLSLMLRKTTLQDPSVLMSAKILIPKVVMFTGLGVRVSLAAGGDPHSHRPAVASTCLCACTTPSLSPRQDSRKHWELVPLPSPGPSPSGGEAEAEACQLAVHLPGGSEDRPCAPDTVVS